MFDLVLGTGNKKKVVELRLLLPEERFSLVPLSEIPDAFEVEETGETFAENAALKAVEQAKHLGRWVLGEDSGLAVDALGGDPGIYSARYGGTHGDDEANNDKLLRALDGVPREKRTAHYHCHICLSDPSGTVRAIASGTCSGVIREKRYGTGGFGYDPLFEIPEYQKTFGELDMSIKQSISHRSKALAVFLPQLFEIEALLQD